MDILAAIHWMEHYSIAAMVLVFVVVAISTYWPGRKREIEQLGRIPLEDDR